MNHFKELQLFLDTADLGQIEKCLQQRIISGLTTNPDIIAKERAGNDPRADYINHVQKMADLCKKYAQEVPISIMVTESEPDKMIAQAREFASKIDYSNLNVKIPIGWEELGVIRELEKSGIKVNCTCGMNEAQAILAANAGAHYFSIFSCHIKDMGGDSFEVIRKSRKLLEGTHTEIIVGGVRPKNMKDLIDAFLAGAHIVTVPLDILERLSGNQAKTEEKVVFTNGVFDILHPGHISLLKFAKSLGDKLIVGINSDRAVKILKGLDRPINDERTRQSVLESLDYVDQVVIFDDVETINIINELKPHILAKAVDLTPERLREIDKVPAEVEVRVCPILAEFSTTEIIRRAQGKK
ncbi:MAG: adenylyltransferase/cytidyltransferase family protein [Candidatus Nealsonbacteria bacterium]|nr:adenylyltransferase/cytidyltransferase family protein [Candidatus Nealsonbacteria bacterium]